VTAVFRFLSRWPLAPLHALGAVLGWLVWLLSPTYRRRFAEHSRQAGYAFAEVRAGVAEAGRLIAELPRLWLGDPVPVRWERPELLEAAFARGRGVLFLTPHLGCFEVTPQALARDHGARLGPITVLYRPARQPWLAELERRARERPHLSTAPTSLAGVRQMLRALKRGEAVGLLPDQVPPEGQGVWAPFFGRPAYTMTLAARLARQSGAAVLLAWGERLPGGSGYCVHLRDLAAPLPEDAERAAAQINAEMERLIRECPAQYLWGYGRYKGPRREVAAKEASS